MMVLVAWVCRRSSPLKVDKWFRRLQLVSAGAYSLGHGGNDAQKTIGVIWMLLIAAGYVGAGDKMPPSWVIWVCYTAIGLGTMFGGWRIVKTMGQRITKLKPVGGFCAETGGAITLWARCAMPRRCAGVWRATSSGPGSSRSLPRPLSLRCFTGSA
jgi:PiT family inorganic phosphate transporter